MKAVILAGEAGSRLTDEGRTRPKAMLEIGGQPLIWHLMKCFAAQGICEFIVCLGRQGYVVKEYFSRRWLHESDVTFDLARQQVHVHAQRAEPWHVMLCDTGLDTGPFERLRAVRQQLDGGDFLLSHGDALADVDLRDLIECHREEHALATLAAVQAPGRFGSLVLDGDVVEQFVEKPLGDGAWIQSGLFVVSPRALDALAVSVPGSVEEPLGRLAEAGQLSAYKHSGFWQPLDGLRDKQQLERMWSEGRAPWKLWDDDSAPADETLPVIPLPAGSNRIWPPRDGSLGQVA